MRTKTNKVWPERPPLSTMGRITIHFEVANFADILANRQGKLPPEKIRRIVMQGLVDPGSAHMVLPDKIAKELGIPVTGKVKVSYADRRSRLCDVVEGVYVTIQGRGGSYRATLEKKRQTALIGAIVLEDLDFLVDCKKNKLIPRDPDYILSEIE
jgi:predicted aspartyl protease